MQSVLIYLIKVIVCSGIFFLYYLIALRNKKFHPYNRFYLLFSAVLSCILPLLHVSMFDVNSNNEKMLRLMQLMYGSALPDVTVGGRNVVVDWQQVVFFASLMVTVVLLCLIPVRIFHIYRLKKSFPSTKIEEIDFVNTDIQSAPFSFFRNLFWRNDIELDDETGSQIFRHEMAHIEQKHSWDKLFFQILKAVFWMNPVFYFMNRELLLIHEFIADEKALKEGDGESFARMLLLTQVGKFAFEPAHPFFYSTIKKRLQMITGSQKTKFSYLRRVMVLPLLGIVSFVFAFRAHRIETKETEVVLDNMIRVMNNEYQNDSPRLLSKNYIALGTAKPDTLSAQALYIINGKAVKQKDVSSLNPDNIANITVLKDKAAVAPYGEEGKNGVILIKTKASPKNKLPDSLKEKPLARIVAGHPLYVIDGKIADKGNADLLGINPSSIQKISVLKGMPAESIYGLRGKDGVIDITTKSNKTLTFKPDDSVKIGYRITLTTDDENTLQNKDNIHRKDLKTNEDRRPSVFVSGRASSYNNGNKINPDDIETISIYANGNKNSSYKNKIAIFTKMPVDSALIPIIVKGYGKKKGNNQDIMFTSVQQEPAFPGGPAAWQYFLKTHLKQNIPVDNGAPAGQYAVTVSFLVDKKGNISEVKAIDFPTPDYGTAAEAARVIAASSPWSPPRQNGRVVTYRQKQRIIFTVQGD